MSTQQREGETPAGYQGTAVQAPDMHDAAWLHQRYVDEGRSLAQIGAEVGCSGATVFKALRAHGIPRRGGGPAPGTHRAPGSDRLADAGWLRHRYIGDGMSCAQIAAELGCSAVTVNRALRRHGIARRATKNR